jgi:phosphatidylserine/phosphatidylglycerophosphate/cardiolipin synthase-like enzyme
LAAAAVVSVVLGAGVALRNVGDRAAPSTGRTPSAGPAAIAGALSVYAEPDAGLGPVYRLIDDARHAVRMTMYELRDSVAEQTLAAAARRGVDVRVLLDQNSQRSGNEAAFTYLHSHGVTVAWADPRYSATHEKSVTVDGSVAAVMTGNLVSSDADTRDFVIIDRDRADVAAIDATFAADADHRPARPPGGADLVWSPTTSQAALLAVINGATRTIAVENEEMNDPDITAALLRAQSRHVAVTVVLTTDPRWESTLMRLQTAGARIVELADPSGEIYIHAKAIAADAGAANARAFVGSQNFSIPSLRFNRELGLIIRSPRLVSAVAAVIGSDAAR